MAKPLNLTIYYEIGTAVTAKAIQEQLSANSDASEIILHINSPGGSVYEGYTIYNLLKNTGKKITARVDGICASIATLIALSADEIELMPLSQWLVHPPFAGVEGTADDLAAASETLKRIEDTISQLYATKTGKPLEEIVSLMKEDRFLNASEAVEMGFATRILEPLKAVAYYQTPETNKPDNEMTEDVQNSLADKIINGLKGMFNPKNEGEPTPPAPVASSETLENDSKIYFEGELAEGTIVFTDEAMTIQPDNGEYTLKDGRKITVQDGKVSAIAAAAPENNAELEAANAKISELETKIAELTATAAAKDTTISNLKKIIPGGGTHGKSPALPQNHAADTTPAAELVPFNNAAEKLKAKYNRK